MAIVKTYNKKMDVTYVYETYTEFDPELRKNRTRRKLIGKIDKETGQVVPTGPRGRRKKDPDADTEKKDEGDSVPAAAAAKPEEEYSESDIAALRAELAQLQEQKRMLTESIMELEKLFSDLLGEKGVTVRTEKLRDGSVPAVINVSEYLRRTQEMGKYYGYGAEEEKESLTLIVNTANGAVQALKTAGEEEKKEGAKFLFLLALMNYRTLKPEELAEFTASAARFAENFLKTK